MSEMQKAKAAAITNMAERIVELEEQIKQQAVVIEQMREAIGELLCTGEFPTVSFLQAEEALALQPCPEVLNKVKRDAIIENAEAWKDYAQRIEKEKTE